MTPGQVLPERYRRFRDVLLCTGCDRQWRIRRVTERTLEYLIRHAKECQGRQRRQQPTQYVLDPEFDQLSSLTPSRWRRRDYRA